MHYEVSQQSLIDAEPLRSMQKATVSGKEFMKTLADKRRAEKKDEEEVGCGFHDNSHPLP